MHEAHLSSCEKFITLMGGCSYPNSAVSPINEDQIWNGYPHEGAAAYSSAKKMNIVMSESYRTQFNFNSLVLVPGNIYGPYDNFDLENSHVLPAMIRKFHEAKEDNHASVVLWGSGSPLREFLHVDDLAQAVLFALEHKLDNHLYNVGSGSDLTIKALAEMIQKNVGHSGDIFWDETKPDGTPKKLMDSSKLNSLGWRSTIDLEKGIKMTYDWFLEYIKSFKELDIN